jgi:exodeoxyribonuclease VII small subunit
MSEPGVSGDSGGAGQTARARPPSTQHPTFEDARRELEEIVGRLERGDVPIDEAIALWQRGEELYRHCQALLDVAEGRIEELARDTSTG